MKNNKKNSLLYIDTEIDFKWAELLMGNVTNAK